MRPDGHSVAEEQGEADAATIGYAQRAATQLLVVGGEILVGNGVGRGFVYRGFF